MYMYKAPQRDKGYLTTQRDKGYMLSDRQTRKTRRDIRDKELHKTIHNHVIIYKNYHMIRRAAMSLSIQPPWRLNPQRTELRVVYIASCTLYMLFSVLFICD